MPIQLTSEQEQRIRAVVESGSYANAEEAVEAAVSALEAVAADSSAGGPEQLEESILEGLRSPSLTEEDFWLAVESETDAVRVSHRRTPRN